MLNIAFKVEEKRGFIKLNTFCCHALGAIGFAILALRPHRRGVCAAPKLLRLGSWLRTRRCCALAGLDVWLPSCFGLSPLIY